MNIPTKKLKNIKSILIHEFGHLFAYCLANKNKETYFCEPLKIDFGYRNFITPSEKIFHMENLLKDRNQIKENTKNIKRTLAWFIEVICGCDFETEYENTSFTNCFCPNSNCSGSLDFANLSVIRNLSSFNWSFNNIYNLQFDIRKILLENDIYKKVETIVDDFLEEYGENDFYILENEELNSYTEKFNLLITEKLQIDYKNLIETYYTKFS